MSASMQAVESENDQQEIGKLIELLLHMGKIPRQLLKPVSPDIQCLLDLYGMGTIFLSPQNLGGAPKHRIE